MPRAATSTAYLKLGRRGILCVRQTLSPEASESKRRLFNILPSWEAPFSVLWWWWPQVSFVATVHTPSFCLFPRHAQNLESFNQAGTRKGLQGSLCAKHVLRRVMTLLAATQVIYGRGYFLSKLNLHSNFLNVIQNFPIKFYSLL
jgi:hypothetical protein